MLCENESVSSDLRHLSHPPHSTVFEYRSMSAYGNHFRVEDPAQGNPYRTFDSGVACIGVTVCQNSASDRRPVEAHLKYVGIVRNIIQVDYDVLKVNVLSCSWIKPDVAANSTMKQDEHGFWLIKNDAFLRAHVDPYIFPAQASQVFYLR